MTVRQALLGVLLVLLLVTGLSAWKTGQSLKAERAAHSQLQGAVQQQNRDAEALLKTRTAERDALQARINEARRLQEISDANNAATIAAQKRRLASLAAAAAGRLRDPNADAGCRGGDAPGAAAPAAGPGAGHAAEAGGLLSADLSGLLLRLTREADAINAAYASCRPDALNLRGQQPLPAPPAPEPIVKEPP